MSSPLDILLEMGFPQSRAEKALVLTGNQGAEAAMEWLLVHNDDPGVDEPLEEEASSEEMETSTNTTLENNENCEHAPEESLEPRIPSEVAVLAGVSGAGNSETEESEPAVTSQALSIKCDTCGKLLKSSLEVNFHAAQRGHNSFSESTEEIKPLTEEERAEQLKQLQEKMKQRRLQKEQEKEEEERKKERMRRRTGQEMLESKKRMEEEEIKRLAAQRRQEKLDEKLARQKILEQIERDKQARREKFSSPSNPVETPVVSNSAASTTADPAASKKEYTETRLQIRLTNGQTLIQSFGSKEELAAVRLYVEMNRTDGSNTFSLMTTYPKKVFSEEDMEKPLYQLGLVPSAVLVLTKVLARGE